MPNHPPILASIDWLCPSSSHDVLSSVRMPHPQPSSRRCSSDGGGGAAVAAASGGPRSPPFSAATDGGDRREWCRHGWRGLARVPWAAAAPPGGGLFATSQDPSGDTPVERGWELGEGDEGVRWREQMRTALLALVALVRVRRKTCAVGKHRSGNYRKVQVRQVDTGGMVMQQECSAGGWSGVRCCKGVCERWRV